MSHKRKTRKRLSTGARIWSAAILGAAAVMILLIGVAYSSAMGAIRESAAGASLAADGAAASVVTPEISSSSAAPPQPIVSHQSLEEKSVIPFPRTTVDDASAAVGTKRVTVAGVNGEKTKTWDIAFTDGRETARTIVSEEVTTAPVAEVTSVGTRVVAADPPPAAEAPPAQVEPPQPAPPEPSCDPNYSGACVPIASDVDCAGGSGNGPAYVEGPVYVIGGDPYDLDRDGDGVGCQG